MMKKVKADSFRKIMLVVFILLAIINGFMIDFENVFNFKLNSGPYLGLVSMLLMALSMFLSMTKK